MYKEELLKKMYVEEYRKGERKPTNVSYDIDYYIFWLVDYMIRKTLFNSVRTTIVYHHDDTYNITFTDKSNGYRMKFYNVHRNITDFCQANTK